MDNNELLQAIRGIIKEEVREVVRDEVRTVIKEEVDPKFDKIDARFDKLENRMENFEDTMLLFNHRLDKMEITIENDINKNIKALHEGFEGINQKLEKLDKIEEDVEDLKMRVEIIEGYIKENTYVN